MFVQFTALQIRDGWNIYDVFLFFFTFGFLEAFELETQSVWFQAYVYHS